MNTEQLNILKAKAKKNRLLALEGIFLAKSGHPGGSFSIAELVTYLYNCEKDGDMFLTLKLYRNFNDTWRAKRTLTRASEEKLESYRQGLERAAGARKAAVKHRRRPRKKSTADQQPAHKQPETV